MTRSPRLIRRDAAHFNLVAKHGTDKDISILEDRWGMSLTSLIDTLIDEAIEADLLDVVAQMEALYEWLTK
jgi:hypothetical protein